MKQTKGNFVPMLFFVVVIGTAVYFLYKQGQSKKVEETSAQDIQGQVYGTQETTSSIRHLQEQLESTESSETSSTEIDK